MCRAAVSHLRSDAYEVLENGQVRLHASRQGKPPVITLSDEYKLVDAIEGLGVPGLIGCDSLEIRGPVRFSSGVVIEGALVIENADPATKVIPAGSYRDMTLKP